MSNQMRKVVAGLFMSLDGVVESPEKWQFDHFDSEMMMRMSAQIEFEDTVLLGRKTYQEWAAFWPTSKDEPFASHINNMPKYVVSNTLDTVDWQNSFLIKGSLSDEIARLKRLPGKNIGVAGSTTLAYSLLLANLLDELTLMIHPVVVGKGRRFFTGESELKRLDLVDSQTTSTGVVIVTYQSRKS